MFTRIIQIIHRYLRFIILENNLAYLNYLYFVAVELPENNTSSLNIRINSNRNSTIFIELKSSNSKQKAADFHYTLLLLNKT
ncbi:MAG: hypothetical protein ACR2KB_00980 [Chitinophagaceae bacterium]